jgi:hypothetical protein
MAGNLYPDFSHFVFYLVYYIIQLQVYIDLGDPVMKILNLRNLPVNVVDQFGISGKTHCLNVNVHNNDFFSGETINKELWPGDCPISTIT